MQNTKQQQVKTYSEMPHSLEAEQSVLGAVLLDNTVFDRISDTLALTSDDFFSLAHKEIFKAMTEIHQEHVPIDIITLSDKMLLNSEILKSVGGISYLANIADAIPTTANVMYYAKIVKENATKRSIIFTATDLITEVYGDKKVDDLLEIAQKKFSNTATSTITPLVHAKEIAIDVLEGLQELSKSDKGMVGVPTGFKSLDGYLGGFQDTDLIVVAGRPSMGKALALDSDILLSSGKFKKMGNIVLGDKVASVDGESSVVTGVFPQGKRSVYNITFRDGRSVEADLEHQWSVLHADSDISKVMTTREIMDELGEEENRSKLYIQRHSGISGIDIDLIIHPYALGQMLINGEEKQTLKSLKKLGLYNKLDRELSIPKRYLEASIASRIKLFKGLIDGGMQKNSDGSIVYPVKNKKLAFDIQLLSRLLGCYAELSSKAYTRRPAMYTLFIKHDNPAIFGITHKVDSPPSLLNFMSMEYVGEKEVQCISVDHPSELYLTNDCIVTHNTAFSIQVATSIAFAQKEKVGIFSIEVGRKQLIKNIMACQARVSTDKFKTANFNEDDWGKIGKVTTDIAMSNLYVDETSRSSLAISRQARRMKIEHGLDIIFIDHLQQMHEGVRSESRALEIGKITGNLKDLAKELEIPVVLISQLNRGVASRDNKIPTMVDLKESGSIEQDADVIIFIHRDEYYTGEDSMEPGKADIVIAKQRNGLTASLKLDWIAPYVRFENLTQ